MAEDFSKSRAAPPAGDLRGPRAYEPPPPGWRPGKTASPLTGERPDSRGQAPPQPRPYPQAGGLPFPHALPGLPLTHLMQHWVSPPVSRASLYPLPGAPGAHPAAEELMQLERDQRLIAQHRQAQQQAAQQQAQQQQQQAQQQPPISSREAAEKQQREAEKQQREAEKQQREAAERLRQEEERKKQQQAVSQHFAESMRLMQQKGRLAPPGSSGGGGGLQGLPAPPGGRFGELRPGDGSSEPERMIRDSIHRLYQSTEPAAHKPEPPGAAAGRPGYPAPDYLAYYDHLKGVQQMHAAKPPQPPPPQPQQQPPVGDRHSPYLPQPPPGQPSYKPPLSHPPHGRSPVPPEARLPPPPRPAPAHGGERSCSPYLPLAPAPPPPQHRPVYSPPAGLSSAASGPPPPAHGGRRAMTPPAQLHQTLDLSVGSRAAQSGRESPKRPASTPVLNLGVSPAKRPRPEGQLPPAGRPEEPLSLLTSAVRATASPARCTASPARCTASPARLTASPVRLTASPALVVRDAWSAPPAPPPPPVVISSASAPASGTSSPAPPDVVVKVEVADSRPPTYTHKLKKKWLQRHAGGDTESTSSSSVNGSDVPAEQPNGSVEGAKPAVKVSPPASVKSEPAEPEAAASPAPMPVVRSTPPSPPTAPEQPKVAVTVNGDGDSDSSDSTIQVKRKPPPRRKPPKKAALEIAPTTPTREAKRQKVSDVSDTDSDKVSEDDGAPMRDARKQDVKAAKKPRGRRTKEKPAKTPKRSAKPEKKEPSPPKKVDAFKRPSVSKLKKSGASFLQDQSCCDLSSKLPKCRECRIAQTQRNKKLSNICCRFTAFRRLRYTKSGVLTVAGFCDPEKDAEEEDQRLWLPVERDQSPPPPQPQPQMKSEVARLLLSHASNQFCELVGDEQEAARRHMNTDKTVAWKRVVQGYREMCDVCETTLFNVHWVCSKCGFAVCMDCYRGRQESTARAGSEPGRDRDRFQWMLCSSRQPHDQQRLMLTQIVTGDALSYLGGRVHEARRRAGMALACQCEAARRLEQPETAVGELSNGARHKMEDYDGGEQGDKQGSPLTLLADVALYDSRKNSDVSNSESETEGDKEDDLSTLRNLLMRNTEGGQLQEKPPTKKDRPKTGAVAAPDEAFEKASSQSGQPGSPDQPELKYFVRREAAARLRPTRLPARVMTPSESQRHYPDVRHGWLCDGRLLRLTEPSAAGAVRLFRDQWRRGQPVLCSGVGARLDATFWSPDSFTRDFGEEQTETVDCASGAPLAAQPQRHFWDGFVDAAQRSRDDAGQPRVLKLREWPPGEDFADVMPARYNDLITALPVTEYTRRDGRLNLAGCLPDCFVRPDLGPRLHAAYGSASGPVAASLHQDVSDAVNILAHVAGAEASGEDEPEVQRAVEEAGCDPLTKRRVKEERAGAMWHIYHAADADKIRDLLNKVSVERGEEADPEHDPLLESSWYLDGPLRRRLQAEYGVSGYAVLQCQGDAVFVPAGAPHQVRQLRSCVSATVEFVSPENVGVSFELTQQLRAAAAAAAAAASDGSQTAGHDDKRQIKNIIYHAMKDAVSCLLLSSGAATSPPAGAS